MEFLNFNSWGTTKYSIMYPIIILAGFCLAALLVRYIFTHLGVRLVKQTKTDLDDKALELAEKPVFYIIILLGFYFALNSINFESKINSIIRESFFVALAIMVAVFVYRMINLLLTGYSQRIDTKERSNFKQEFMPLVKKIASILVFLVGLIGVLRHFNYDIFSLITALGVGSLAIGLAAKETLSNMIAGFAIMIDRPFRPGDRIELSSGEIGDVADIGLRSTKIRTFDHTIIVVPNAELVNYKLINQSYPDQLINGKIELGIAYGSDVSRAKDIMIEAASSVPHVLSDPPPVVYFINFGESSLDLLLRFWVEDYAKAFITKDRINMTINERFKEEGIEIPFPIRTIYKGN